ncbi:MAG: hypothetical protein VXZ12_07550 [SAR324 cluster bacterium]|nr:hypothetical protein [SAR324 cluster bacterium]
MGEGLGRALSDNPHLPLRAPPPQGDGFPSLIEIVDSATPGQALRAE